MRTVTFLNRKEIEDIAWKAISESDLPQPRGLRIEEQEGSSGDDIIVIGLLVTDNDNLGTAQQRFEVGGKIQSAVWKSGDSRSAIMQHFAIVRDIPQSPVDAV